jgi:hypothetical protein
MWSPVATYQEPHAEIEIPEIDYSNIIIRAIRAICGDFITVCVSPDRFHS